MGAEIPEEDTNEVYRKWMKNETINFSIYSLRFYTSITFFLW